MQIFISFSISDRILGTYKMVAHNQATLYSGIPYVRILRSQFDFIGRQTWARATGTLLKCCAKSQNARNSDRTKLRNVCPQREFQEFLALPNTVWAIEMQYHEMDRSSSLPIKSDLNVRSSLAKRLYFLFVSRQHATIIWKILSLVRIYTAYLLPFPVTIIIIVTSIR